MQEIGIESSILADILSGRKTIEGRLGKPKYIKMRVGDILSIREDVWEDGKIKRSIPDSARVVITQLLYFEAFEAMLNSLDFNRALPGATSVHDALKTYRQFYSFADEEEYGVVAITFKLTRAKDEVSTSKV
jgi:ASC-1-like (ASCH) protein